MYNTYSLEKINSNNKISESYIIKFDYLSQTQKFYKMNGDKVSFLLGKIFSIILLCLAIPLIYFFGKDFILRTNPNIDIYSSKLGINYNSTLNLNIPIMIIMSEFLYNVSLFEYDYHNCTEEETNLFLNSSKQDLSLNYLCTNITNLINANNILCFYYYNGFNCPEWNQTL